MSSLVAKLEVVVRRHDEIQALLADHPEPGSADYTRLTREYAEMNPIVEQMRGFQKLVSDLDDAVALAEAEDDAEMRAPWLKTKRGSCARKSRPKSRR